jgi:hypothetical protein
MLLRATVLGATVCLLLTASARAETYNAYAGPNTWGPAVQVKGHVGSVTYTITYSAVGNTSVIGEVTYQGPGGQVTKHFNGSITFTTGRVVGAPTVRFRGIPFGSAVRVTVSP